MGKDTHLLDLVRFFESNQELHGMFRYNLMTKDIEFTKQSEIMYWNHNSCLTDEDIVHLKEYISTIKRFEYTNKQIEEAVMLSSKRKAYNPLKDYLDGLKWDGIERIDRWLVALCGCKNNVYVREVGRKFLCGTVARALNPGCKFDYMLILEGGQGIGKSTLVEIFGGDWYIDTHLCGSENKKDLIDIIRTAWMVEISDMAGFKKNDIEYLKAFITRKIDNVRLPYDRRTQPFPRQCVFIGTHNPSGSNEYFRDDTGNRRFWCVECNDINIELAKKCRDQLFAEAVVKYRQGETLYLDNKESLDILIELQDKRQVSNPLNDLIDAYCMGKSFVTNIEVINRGLEMDHRRMSYNDLRSKQTIIGVRLAKNGWSKETIDGVDGYKNNNMNFNPEE